MPGKSKKRSHSSLQQFESGSFGDSQRRLHHVDAVAAANYYPAGSVPMESSMEFLSALRGLQTIPPNYLSAPHMQHSGLELESRGDDTTEQLLRRHAQAEDQAKAREKERKKERKEAKKRRKAAELSAAAAAATGLTSFTASAAISAPVTATTSSSASSSLWERKCSILEEELAFRKKQQNSLQAEIDSAARERQLEETFIQSQQAEIQTLTLRGGSGGGGRRPSREEKEATKVLKQHVEKELGVRRQHESTIQQQRIVIQKLTEDLNKSAAARRAAAAAAIATAEVSTPSKAADPNRTPSEEIDDIRDQLIKSRRKQVELVRSVENWKQKAFALQQKLEALEQSSVMRAPRSTEDVVRNNISRSTQNSRGNKNEVVDLVSMETESDDLASAGSTSVTMPRIEHGGQLAQQVGQLAQLSDSHKVHGICTAPTHARCFDGTQWIRTKKVKHPRYLCKHKGCQRRIRTYCKCSPGFWRCDTHALQHIKEDIENSAVNGAKSEEATDGERALKLKKSVDHRTNSNIDSEDDNKCKEDTAQCIIEKYSADTKGGLQRVMQSSMPEDRVDEKETDHVKKDEASDGSACEVTSEKGNDEEHEEKLPVRTQGSAGCNRSVGQFDDADSESSQGEDNGEGDHEKGNGSKEGERDEEQGEEDNEDEEMDEEGNEDGTTVEIIHNNETHGIATAPRHAMKFDGKHWFLTSIQKYPQHQCRHSGCNRRIRTYCKCSPGFWRCRTHVCEHLDEVAREKG